MVAASLGGAPLIAIDVVAAKLEFAVGWAQLTRSMLERLMSPDKSKEICPGGVDLAIEAAGVPAVMEMAFNAVKPGGLCVLSGNVSFGQKISIDPFDRSKVSESREAGWRHGA